MDIPIPHFLLPLVGDSWDLLFLLISCIKIKKNGRQIGIGDIWSRAASECFPKVMTDAKLCWIHGALSKRAPRLLFWCLQEGSHHCPKTSHATLGNIFTLQEALLARLNSQLPSSYMTSTKWQNRNFLSSSHQRTPILTITQGWEYRCASWGVQRRSCSTLLGQTFLRLEAPKRIYEE